MRLEARIAESRLADARRELDALWTRCELWKLSAPATCSTGDERLGARDALHAAVVLARRMAGLCSYDRDLDRIAGVRRLEPPAA